MIIFDEISYAESILRYGCSKKNVLIDFKILAKYFLYYKKYSEQETKELMLNILKDSQTFIPINYLMPKIDRAITFAKTEALKVCEPIKIYQEEIDAINKLPKAAKDLAFVYLFLFKWAKDEKGFFIRDADVKRLLGNSSIRSKGLQNLNRILEESQFIKFVDTRTKELVKVLISKNEGDVVFEIVDFEHALLHYKLYLGERILYCNDCNCLVKPTSNRQKYCKACAKKNKQQQINECKRRNKNKSL